MIEYEYNTNKQRWEFIFVTPDKEQFSLGYLLPNQSEEERMRTLVKWFNACLRQYNEQETPSK